MPGAKSSQRGAVRRAAQESPKSRQAQPAICMIGMNLPYGETTTTECGVLRVMRKIATP